jgi:hypothetical protein
MESDRRVSVTQRASGPGEFNTPTGLAVANGRIIVADKGNARLQVFDLGGTFLFEAKLAKALKLGNMHPFAVAVDPAGNMIASDEPNKRLAAFDAMGTFLYTRGAAGSGPGQLENPRGLASSALGMVRGQSLN